MKAGMWMTMMAALGVLTAGCENAWTCSDFCAEAKKCESKASLDCTTLCQSADTMTKDTTCGSEWDFLMTCEQDHASEICGGTACGTELSDWGMCALTYCLQNLGEPVCTTSAFD